MNEKNPSLDAVAGEWRKNAEALMEWVWRVLVNSADRHGRYSTDFKTYTAGQLSEHVLRDHTKATEANHVVGLHSTVVQDGRCWSRWLLIDIDNHDKRPVDPAKNFAYALALAHRLRSMGFRVLLSESNGLGGFHARL